MENVVILNYNWCKLLNFTRQIEEPLSMLSQRLVWDYYSNIYCYIAIVWISMSICFNFYLLTNFLASDVLPKLLILHHWKFFEWWASKIYDIRRDEWIKKLLYYINALSTLPESALKYTLVG